MNGVFFSEMIVKKRRKDYNENCYARNKKGGVLFFVFLLRAQQKYERGLMK
ncbi:hypothetical protein N786_13525 [Bacillus amyloliquefaciens UASWS BA1]|nr:hypothetical protein N786_13525 [Bacillus amyloliquefaciens UASWS BA1]